jgi:hypothetical protein
VVKSLRGQILYHFHILIAVHSALLSLAPLVVVVFGPLRHQTLDLVREMDITLAELLQVVPGLVYAVLVILIYRDGAKQMDARDQRLTSHHREELDRLNAVHNARVEAFQTLLERYIDEDKRERLLSKQLREYDDYLRSRSTKAQEG